MASEECSNPAGVVVCVREDGQTLPLMIRPEQGNTSVNFLKTWIAENKQWLDEKLLEYGEPSLPSRGCGYINFVQHLLHYYIVRLMLKDQASVT